MRNQRKIEPNPGSLVRVWDEDNWVYGRVLSGDRGVFLIEFSDAPYQGHTGEYCRESFEVVLEEAL